MIRTITCVVVHCDVCLLDVDTRSDEYTGPPHFVSEAEARKALSGDPDLDRSFNGGELAAVGLDDTLTMAGWPAGTVVCFTCLSAYRCTTFGHAWDAWSRCRCAGRIAGHRTHGCPHTRGCTRACCFVREVRYRDGQTEITVGV